MYINAEYSRIKLHHLDNLIEIVSTLDLTIGFQSMNFSIILSDHQSLKRKHSMKILNRERERD
jgi:hypothetical protein